MSDATERRLLAAAEEANERIRTCHKRVACPKCRAPIGKRCAAMRGYGGGGYVRVEVQVGQRPARASMVQMGALLKHPHRERWTLGQPAR